MPSWNSQAEENLSLLIKDWLKHYGRTQADLRESLQAMSSRMPSLLDVLRREYALGGFPQVAAKLCSVEEEWSNDMTHISNIDTKTKANPKPSGQLDLLLQEIIDDCDKESSK